MKRVYPPMKRKPNEFCVIRGLLNYNNSEFNKKLSELYQDSNDIRKGFDIATDKKYSGKGWLPVPVIRKMGGYKGQTEAFNTNCIKPMVANGIIAEKKGAEYCDNRGRKKYMNVYRIVRSQKVLRKLLEMFTNYTLEQVESGEFDITIEQLEFEGSDYYEFMVQGFKADSNLLKDLIMEKVKPKYEAALKEAEKYRKIIHMNNRQK